MEECHRLLHLGLPIDRARMAERAEPRFAAVGAHAGCADPAVWHVLDEHVRHDVIDRYAAGGGAVEHLASPLIVRAEIVESQQTREMRVIYDRCVVDGAETVRVHATRGGDALLGELTLASCRYQGIVRREA